MKNKKIFIALDTETTDLLKPDSANINLQPYMTEICAIKFDSKFNVIGKYSSLVKVPVPIPEFITKLTGIDDAMLKKQKPFKKQWKDIRKFFSDCDAVVGHNVQFDMEVLKFELRRIQKEHNFCWPIERLCTIELSYALENKRLKLAKLYELATGKQIENAHRAEDDVLATIECFKWLSKNGMV